MKRRIWILALVLVMLISALPVGAAAEDARSELYKKARKSYTSSLASYGRSSFHGYCATLVAYQLRHAGITKKAKCMTATRTRKCPAAVSIFILTAQRTTPWRRR